ncbi:hypothetical protein [Caulobacter segnis]
MTDVVADQSPPTQDETAKLREQIKQLLELVEKVPTWLRAVIVASVCVLVPTLMVNRYLKVFGQPSLGAFGDNLIVGLMQTVGLVLLFLILLVGSSLAAPIFTRHFFAITDDDPGIARHLNTPFFEARKDDDSASHSHPFLAYLAVNATFYVLAGLEIASPLFPDNAPEWRAHALTTGALLASPLASLLFTWILVKPKAGKRAKAYFLAALISIGFLMAAVSWMFCVLSLLDPNLDLRGNASVAHSAILMVGASLTHFVLTAASHRRGAPQLLAAFLFMIVMLFLPGDQIITFNALRLSGAGGGVVNFYPEPARTTLGGPPRPACLILAAGGYRVVRLTDDAEDCSAARMAKLYNTLRETEAPAEKQKLVCGIVQLPRQAFDATLTLTTTIDKTAPKPTPILIGCPKQDAKALWRP